MATAELQLDAEKLFEAIDRRRRRLKMRRKDVAAELGVSPAAVTFWGAGGGIGADAALRICCWLGVDIKDFAKQHEAA
jgi:transcriptional regulator with XRE-family HTH domain